MRLNNFAMVCALILILTGTYMVIVYVALIEEDSSTPDTTVVYQGSIDCTASWEVTIQETVGDSRMLVRRISLKDSESGRTINAFDHGIDGEWEWISYQYALPNRIGSELELSRPPGGWHEIYFATPGHTWTREKIVVRTIFAHALIARAMREVHSPQFIK